MVTLKSSELSSLRGLYGTGPYSFNFADLIEPVPWIAWVAQSSCRIPADCETVTPGKYVPFLALPAQVKLLDPAWMSCQLVTTLAVVSGLMAVNTVPNFLTDTASASPAATPASKVAPLTSTPLPATTVPTQTQLDLGFSIQLPTSTVVDPASSFGNPPATLTHASAPLLTIGGIIFSVDPSNSGAAIIGTATLKPGDAITISTLSFSAISTDLADPASEAVFTLGSQTLSADPTSLVIGATILTPGGPALTTNGETISLGASGVVIAGPAGTSTISFADPSAKAVFTLGSVLVTAAPTGVVIGSVTLIPGGAALTTDGETISFGPSGVAIAGPSGTSTISFSNPSAKIEATLALGSETLTAEPTGLVIGSSTLKIGGPAITTDGEMISLGPSGVVVVGPGGSSTVPFSTVVPSASVLQYTGGAVKTWVMGAEWWQLWFVAFLAFWRWCSWVLRDIY